MEPRDGGAAALRVLTQRPLLRHIASFLPGLPFLVGEFLSAGAAAAGPLRHPELALMYPQPRGLLPQLAIMRGDLSMLARLRALSREPEHRGDPRLEFHEVVRCAVMFGRLDVLEWLARGAVDLSAYAFEGNLASYAIQYGGSGGGGGGGRGGGGKEGEGGELAVLDWLHANVPRRFVRLRPWQVCLTASRGNLRAVQWLHRHDFPGFSPAVMDAAAASGQLDVVRFLHEHRAEGCSVEAMDMAASNGHLDVVRFLHEHRAEGCSKVAMGAAASFGHAHVVRFLGEHRREGPYDRALEDAAGHGHLESVRALVRLSTRGCLFQARKRAAKNKHRRVAEFLSSQMADGVWTCSAKRHAALGPRRCQKPLADATVATDDDTSASAWKRTFLARWIRDATGWSKRDAAHGSGGAGGGGGRHFVQVSV